MLNLHVDSFSHLHTYVHNHLTFSLPFHPAFFLLLFLITVSALAVQLRCCFSHPSLLICSHCHFHLCHLPFHPTSQSRTELQWVRGENSFKKFNFSLSYSLKIILILLLSLVLLLLSLNVYFICVFMRGTGWWSITVETNQIHRELAQLEKAWQLSWPLNPYQKRLNKLAWTVTARISLSSIGLWKKFWLHIFVKLEAFCGTWDSIWGRFFWWGWAIELIWKK